MRHGEASFHWISTIRLILPLNTEHHTLPTYDEYTKIYLEAIFINGYYN